MKAHPLLKVSAIVLLLAITPRGHAATVSAPIIMPGSGTYFDSVDVAIFTTTVGATIFYTTDGTIPTTDDDPFTLPFTLTESTVVKAFAIKTGDTDSAVSTAVFDVLPTPESVTPTITISGKKSLKTMKAKIKIRGTSTDATSVEYQIGPNGDFNTARGSSAWNFTAKLKPGKNVFYVYAIGEEEDSEPAKVTVRLIKKK